MDLPELTPEERAELIAERAAQGLPPTVQNPVVLAKVARLLARDESA